MLHVEASAALARIAEGEADVGVRVGDGHWPDLQADKLLDLLLLPVCAPSVAARLRTVDDLAGVPVVEDRHSRYRWDDWLAAEGRAGMALTRGPVFSDSALCLEAVAAGNGVTLAWQTLAGDALAAGRVVAPFDRIVDSGHDYWFVRPRGRPARPVEAAFRSWLAGRLAPLALAPFEAMLAEKRAAIIGRR